MFLRQLELTAFRNLCPQRISFERRVTVIVGANGQGKTNLLEAVFILAQAKSFRSVNPRELVCWSAGSKNRTEPGSEPDCVVNAVVETGGAQRLVRFEVHKGKRRVYLNSNRVSRASLFYGQLQAVAFTPDDLELVKGPPTVRRFIDRTIAMSDPAYTEALVRYQRALKNRNALLKGAKRERTRAKQPQSISAKLAPWTDSLVEEGRKIAQTRSACIDKLSGYAGRYHKVVADNDPRRFGPETLLLGHRSSFLAAEGLKPQAELLELYQDSLERDLNLGVTTEGIHRDELVIELALEPSTQPARAIASQGQARSIALSLILGAVELLSDNDSQAPILLLDDVESELDVHRRASLYRLLQESKSQILLTTTELSGVLKEQLPDAGIMDISNGQVRGAEELFSA